MLRFSHFLLTHYYKLLIIFLKKKGLKLIVFEAIYKPYNFRHGRKIS